MRSYAAVGDLLAVRSWYEDYIEMVRAMQVGGGDEMGPSPVIERLFDELMARGAESDARARRAETANSAAAGLG